MNVGKGASDLIKPSTKTPVGKGASDPNTNQNQQGSERAPAGFRPPTCQTLIADLDRREIPGLEPAGARSEPCWFWFVFGSLAPFPTALDQSACPFLTPLIN